MEDSGLAGSTGGRSTATPAPVAYERAEHVKKHRVKSSRQNPNTELGKPRRRQTDSNHTKLPYPKILLQQIAVAHVDRVRARLELARPRREPRSVFELAIPLARAEAAVP